MTLVLTLNSVKMARPILSVNSTSDRLDSEITKFCHLFMKPSSVAVRKPRSINYEKNNVIFIFI